MDSMERVRLFISANALNIEVKVLAPDSTWTSKKAADSLGCSVGEIAKTIGFVSNQRGDDYPILVVLSGEKRVSLEKIGRALNVDPLDIRKMTADETKDLTGYSIGGVPPFPHDSGVNVLVDRSLFKYGKVWAAAGSPNSVMRIDPLVLTEKLNMRQADVSE